MASSSDLDAFDAAWRYPETLARQTTGARDTDSAIAKLRRRGITAVIPESADQATRRRRRGSAGGRPAGWL